MKFVPDENRNTAEREFQMLTYLNAINRTEIERFGFPAVYYYSNWKGFILTIISYFDGGDLVERKNKGFFESSSSESKSIDSLILFRDFVSAIPSYQFAVRFSYRKLTFILCGFDPGATIKIHAQLSG